MANSPTPFLLATILVAIISDSTSVIRNDITDRCIHLRFHDKMRISSRKLFVYARGCTWDVPERNMKSHPNEHVEITPSTITTNSILPKLRYLIRKVSDNYSTQEDGEVTCLTSSRNQLPVTSHCSPTNIAGLFEIDIVPQRNFRGFITSTVSFKIRNSEGKCLTVKPGQEELRFKECSPRHGLFQVWSVCRHNRYCDVDLTWSPRKIHFPNGTNATNNMEEDISVPKANPKTKPKAIASPDRIADISTDSTKNSLDRNCPQPPVQPPTSGSNHINEVLYTIQNALNIFDGSDSFLASTVEAFYPQDVLDEAVSLTQKLCRERRFQCYNYCNGISLSGKANLLTRWMMECNVGPHKVEFLSKDVLHVLLNLFPHESPLRKLPSDDDEKLKMIIPPLRKFLSELENRVNAPEPENPTTPVVEWEASEKTGWESHIDHFNESFPSVLDIDIRLGKGSKKI